MSKLLLDALLDDVDDSVKDYIDAHPEVLEKSEKYLLELLVNEDLLSTDVFTTTTIGQDGSNKTLTEEIAELDEQQRNMDLKLAGITNTNRDLIVDVSESLKDINYSITKDMQEEVDSALKQLSSQSKSNVVYNDHGNKAIEVNSSILNNIDSMLDLLELPTLCKICILQGNYQEALEISMLSKNLIIKFPKISIFVKIYLVIRSEIHLMIRNLIKLLNTKLKQNNLIKIFSILNKLDLINIKDSSNLLNSDNTLERVRCLKLIYFNSRYRYIINELSTLEPLIKFDRFVYLKRFIEICRSEMFLSLSMYLTILNHSLNLEADKREDDLLINQFVKNLAYHLIDNLKTHIPIIVEDIQSSKDKQGDQEFSEQEINSQLDGLILQIIYLCKSLSKFGQNFESIMLWELCYNVGTPIISENYWLNSLAKVQKLKT